MTTKRVGDTLTIEHLPEARDLRTTDQRTREAVYVPLPLIRALSSAPLDAAAELAGELVGDSDRTTEESRNTIGKTSSTQMEDQNG